LIHSRFESLGVYLPSTSVSTAEVTERMAYRPPVALASITGVLERRERDRRPESYEGSLTLKAAQRCLRRSRYAAADLDVVISASITKSVGADRFQWEPSMAYLLCQELGARRAVHFDVSNACAGMLTAVTLLDRMIKAGMVRNGLIVSGECITPFTDTAVREVNGLRDPQLASLTLGDSGAAVILDTSPSPADRIHYTELMTCAGYAPLCIGGPSLYGPGIAMYADSVGLHHRNVIQLWPTLHQEHLAKHGGTLAEEGFDYVIPHQVSTNATKRIRKAGEAAFGTLPPMLTVLDRYGNTASTSHFVVLNEHIQGGDDGPAAKFLMVALASGIVAGFLSATISSLEA
jgi:3-oxoacyl-[acyl-carrier-protein] synthase III